VAESIESAGGSFREFTGDNSFGLSCEVLPEDSGLALELLSDSLLRAVFKPSAVGRERDAQLAGIREANDDIVHAAGSRLRTLFFGGHPLAVDSDRTLEMVARLRPKDLRIHRNRLVRSGNLGVAVSGAFDRRELLGRIEESFSEIPEGEVSVPKQKQRLPATVGNHVLPRDREQVIVYHGFPGAGILSGDFMAGEVLDEVFSGMASRLFERVREEKGLAYFVRSGRIVAMNEGMFFFVAGTNPGGFRQVIAELQNEVDRAREGGITEDELRRSQVRLKAGHRMSMQTNSACSIQAALNAVYGLPVNDWRQYDAKVDAVTLKDFQAFARTRFTSENRLELLAGPVENKA
jgi:zinc protease